MQNSDDIKDTTRHGRNKRDHPCWIAWCRKIHCLVIQCLSMTATPVSVDSRRIPSSVWLIEQIFHTTLGLRSGTAIRNFPFRDARRTRNTGLTGGTLLGP